MRKPILREYKTLENFEDVEESIIQVSEKFLASAKGISPLFSAVFLCYIDQCIMESDVPALCEIADVISSQSKAGYSPQR